MFVQPRVLCHAANLKGVEFQTLSAPCIRQVLLLGSRLPCCSEGRDYVVTFLCDNGNITHALQLHCLADAGGASEQLGMPDRAPGPANACVMQLLTYTDRYGLIVQRRLTTA